MSKKKAFCGSTMTLKDFHGGSIPAELPLPSAPGLSARQPDRPVQPAWGRADSHRTSRPGSSPGPRAFDEPSSPFLPVTARIGRHFDEDERKPFEASSAPRRPAVPDPDPVRPALTHARPAARPSSAGSDPLNAWGVIPKEAVAETAGAVPASRFVQASAMDQISSGRWQLRPTGGLIRPGDADGLPKMDRGSTVRSRSEDAPKGGLIDSEVRGRGDEMEARDRGVVNGWMVNGLQGGVVDVKGVSIKGELQFGGTPAGSSEGHYGGLSARQCEERFDGPQFDREEGRFGGQQLQHIEGRLGDLHLGQRGYSDGPKLLQKDDQSSGMRGVSQVEKLGLTQGHNEATETPERPKLKLLPRTKPLEAPLVQNVESKQGLQPKSPQLGAPDVVKDNFISSRQVKPVIAVPEVATEAVERPRLNLKPRSQSIGCAGETIDKERQSVFGGARPREMVLKERGLDTDPNNSSPALSDTRNKNDLPMVVNSTKQDSAGSRMYHHAEKSVFYTVEHHSDKDFEVKDQRLDAAKSDMQRGTRGNNWRNTKDQEKSLEHRPEPDTWRKSVEPKAEISTPRKVASALELAQAFSRSASIPDVSSDARLATNQKAVSIRNQVPFSRLTDGREIYQASATRKVNGY